VFVFIIQSVVVCFEFVMNKFMLVDSDLQKPMITSPGRGAVINSPTPNPNITTMNNNNNNTRPANEDDVSGEASVHSNSE
jgi:hypothetical protein